MESADKSTESLEPEKVTSNEGTVEKGDEENKGDCDSSREKDTGDCDRNTVPLPENSGSSNLGTGDKEEESASIKSPQDDPPHQKSPSPGLLAQKSNDQMKESLPVGNSSVAELSEENEASGENVKTSEPEAIASSNSENEEPSKDKAHSPSPNHSPLAKEGKDDEPSLHSGEKEDSNETEAGIRPGVSSEVNEPGQDDSGSREDTNEISKEDCDSVKNQSSPTSKEDQAENADVAKDIGTSQKKLSEDLPIEAENTDAADDDVASQKKLQEEPPTEAQTADVTEDDVTSQKKLHEHPTEAENADATEDIVTGQKKLPEEQESVDRSPTVEIMEKVEQRVSVVQDAAEVIMEEAMDVDVEKGTDKPPSETGEESHAMVTADFDSESRDDLMEVSIHEEERDPLSSADKEKDVEISTHEDTNLDKDRGCGVEIHTDIVKDEQFNLEDLGDGERSNDSKDKETSKEDSGDGEVNIDSSKVDKKSSKEDSEDHAKGGDSTEKDIGDSKKESGEGTKSIDSTGKNEETSMVLESDSTRDAPDKTSEGLGKTDEAVKTTLQDTPKEGDDDVCIIPDSVPQSVDKTKDIADKEAPATSSSIVKTTETSSDDIEEVEEVVQIKGPRKERRKYRTVLSMTTSIDLSAPRQQRQAARKAESQIRVLAAVESYEPPPDPEPTLTILERVTESHPCQQCGLVTFCKYQMRSKDSFLYFCRELCYNEYQSPNQSSVPIISDSASPPPMAVPVELERPFERTCSKCSAKIIDKDEKVLTWETMDFCSDDCLGKYQTALGSHCANCKGAVQNSSLGKYCVRFGYNIKQFCCAGCLEEFKKGLKVCSYCQKDISSDQGGFLAPVGDKGQFKDFCTQSCMEKYEQMSSAVTPPTPCHECAVCMKKEPVRVEVLSATLVHKLCSQPCFAAFKFVNGIVADQCVMCKKYFDKAKSEHFTIFYDDAPHSFCSKTCMNVYILAKRKIVPCSWCKVKKYNFDMIKKTASNGQVVMMCSLHCLNLYQVSASAVTARRIKCDACGIQVLAQYHLTMSDGTMRNFCSYNCVGNFQSKFSRPAPSAGGKDDPVPTGGPRRASNRRSLLNADTETGQLPKGVPLPVISSVTSLAPNGEPLPAGCSVPGALKVRAQPRNYSDRELADVSKSTSEGGKSTSKQHIIVRPPQQPKRHNLGIQVQPLHLNKGVSIKPQSCAKETQTDDELGGKQPIIVPIPIPIYIPSPMCMYSAPTPIPVPFPLPIPVPIFIPTSRNSTKGIMKEIKRIQEKIPNDPFEAELLMMAEMVAAEKKTDNADESGSEAEPDAEAVTEEPASASATTTAAATTTAVTAADGGNGVSQNFSPEAVDSSNTFGDDIMQMALKFASTLDEQPVDFDTAVAPSTIVSGGTQNEDDASDSDADDSEPTETRRPARKRPARSSSRSSGPNKRSRRISSSESLPIPSDGSTTSKADIERPDANMCLKYTYGVNAWRHWVLQKNAQLEKAASSNRKLKLFKTDLLQLTADELNYSLCLFVKEVRKPNGAEYAPDTIYYLCLGIQLYLIENGRVDNIFSDPLYEKFTECLDEMSKKFCSLYDDTQYIVTRVEEEHLWESKQLGAHSPQVLLSTLMFFNTKHFNITTVDEHMLLSFSHIMKHWKRNNNASGSGGKTPGRNVLLRFYPSQAVLDSNSKKKKVYEQSENEENPLRCPVKLYEFYLSKCPESVKTRNDVFYLQPERSCVPDSPVWYSTMSLSKDTLLKMLRRVKMVKEINMAILK